MNLAGINPLEMAKDAVKQSVLKSALDSLYKDKNPEEFIEEVVKPLKLQVNLKAKYSMENLKAMVVKEAVAKKQTMKLILQALGFNKDSLIYSMVVGQPKVEKSFDSFKVKVGNDRLDKKGNVFFPPCNITDMATLFSAPKNALNSMKEIQENFAFSLDSPLVLPGENAAALAIQSLQTVLADMAGNALGGDKYPKIYDFDQLDKDGKVPDGTKKNPLRFVIMPPLQYKDGVPDQEFLDKLVNFRNKGGRTFLETSEYLAYADVYENKPADPETVFDKYDIKPTGPMRQAVIDISNAYPA